VPATGLVPCGLLWAVPRGMTQEARGAALVVIGERAIHGTVGAEGIIAALGEICRPAPFASFNLTQVTEVIGNPCS
jgi:hypothetical protein